MSRFSLSCPPPVANLPRRPLWFDFPLPSGPLLRAVRIGERCEVDDSPWSAWLQEWGWTWAVSAEDCLPGDAFSRLWLKPEHLPAGFDARVLALATALRLKLGPVSLGAAPGPKQKAQHALERIWPVLQTWPRAQLADVLSLALLQKHDGVFDLAGVCPSWAADVDRVIAERRALQNEREPAPCWLSAGYGLLGPCFESLRRDGDRIEACQAIWQDFDAQHHAPAPFALAFWWEATYCLSERHQYADARQGQERVDALATELEALTGLLEPLWHHQRGRLHYYAGNHVQALSGYLRELARQGDNPLRRAMLERDVANVLSDLACMEAAAHHARLSIAFARQEGQKPEQFKSLGRLAEIRLKQGAVEEAVKLLDDSRKIQESQEDRRSPAQTLCYLGHAHLLAGRSEDAALYYELAAGEDEGGTSLPYLTMGRFALAYQQQDEDSLRQLWNAHHWQIGEWLNHDTHVMPAAACILAARDAVGAAQSQLGAAAKAMLERNYAIEALPFLQVLAGAEAAGVHDSIRRLLEGWQKGLRQLPEDLSRAEAGALDGPAQLLAQLQAGKGVLPQSAPSCCFPLSMVL